MSWIDPVEEERARRHRREARSRRVKMWTSLVLALAVIATGGVLVNRKLQAQAASASAASAATASATPEPTRTQTVEESPSAFLIGPPDNAIGLCCVRDVNTVDEAATVLVGEDGDAKPTFVDALRGHHFKVGVWRQWSADERQVWVVLLRFKSTKDATAMGRYLRISFSARRRSIATRARSATSMPAVPGSPVGS